MKNTEPVKLGIIGCGIAAKTLHYPALNSLQDKFKITAVCNHTESKAKEFSKLVGGVPYTLDYKELLAMEDVEAVDIVLPIHLNRLVISDALKAGKHVIAEKPIAGNLSDAREIVELADGSKQVTMIAENYRYRKVFQRAKDLIKSGAIGDLNSFSWNIYYKFDENNEYARTQWRIDHKYEGGIITDAGVHNIAALRLLFGDIASGYALVWSINPAIGRADSIKLNFKTTNGINGTFNMSASVEGYSENRLLIFGNRGTITVEEDDVVVMNSEGESFKESMNDDGGFKAQFENFYDAVQDGGEVVSTFKEAYKDIEILMNAYLSAERGVPFKIK
ncbi:MAG: Gfo/Idh/MocA family oxidoreductase [Candidatus Marinimicrobia bacterium]|nr:Gfo/Idh/MocA family oxidoreductase [Candidatus Neomarinimicrobiota bacterium]